MLLELAEMKRAHQRRIVARVEPLSGRSLLSAIALDGISIVLTVLLALRLLSMLGASQQPQAERSDAREGFAGQSRLNCRVRSSLADRGTDLVVAFVWKCSWRFRYACELVERGGAHMGGPAKTARVRDIERFLAWVGARDVGPEFLPAYERLAFQLTEGIEGFVYPRDVDAAMHRAEQSGATPKELANLQRVGNALVQYHAALGETPVSTPTEPPAPEDVTARPLRDFRPILARGPQEGGVLSALLWLGGLVGVLLLGWFAYQRLYLGAGSAELRTFDAGRFTVVFHKLPRGCMDPRSVRVEISSTALDEPLTFEWPEIAARSVGRQVDAEAEPPLETPITVHYDLNFKQRLRDPDMGDFLLRARVYWCGRQQDLMRSNVRGMYKEEPAAR